MTHPTLDEFRAAWQGSQPPALADYLPQLDSSTAATWSELLRYDLQQRTARGERVTSEAYLQQFPALASHQQLVVELIEEEYRLRGSSDPLATWDSFLERFPEQRAALSTRQAGRSETQQEQTTSWNSNQLASDTHPMINVSGQRTLPKSLGRFEIRRWLGAGAFGDVYEAFDPQLDRSVAIKVAKMRSGDVEHQVKRFLREAKAAAGLRHPHIVPVYEFGQQGDQFYIASAFIRGQTLRDRLRNQGQFTIPEAIGIIRELGEALAYSHEQGIVHRDLKPANVMLDENGSPMLMDFGLASRLDHQDELTLTGQQLGTPLYMSPEQARGKDGAAIPASDQYSLGVMLYELIAGRTPFSGSVETLMFHQLSTEPTPPRRINRAISRDLETVCLKCLRKDPAQRYPTTKDLVDDLRRLEMGDPIRARRESLFVRGWRCLRKNPLTTASLAVVLGLLLVSGWIWLASQDQRRKASADRRLAEITSRLERHLQNTELSPAYLEQGNTILQELAVAHPTEPNVTAASRLHQAYADQIRQAFRDRLRAEDIPVIEQAIQALVKYEPSLAASVRSEFQLRQATWQPQLTLQAPFDALDQAFDASGYRIEKSDQDSRLRRHQGGDSPPREFVSSRIPALSQQRIVLVFDETWAQTSGRIAVKLPGDADQGYSLSIIPSPHERTTPGQQVVTTAQAAQRGEPVRLLIDRTQANKTQVVAVYEIAAEDLLASCRSDRSLRVEVKREGALVTFIVNQLPAQEYEDPMPLAVKPSGRVMFNWPAEVKLQSLTTYERALPPVASELEQADAAFNSGNYDEATRLYSAASITTTNVAAQQECQYKLGLCLQAQGDLSSALEKFRFVAGQTPPQHEGELPRWGVLANCQLLRYHLRDKTPDGYRQANQILDHIIMLRGKHREVIPRLLAAGERNALVFEAGGTGLSLFTNSPDRLLQQSERVERFLDLFEPHLPNRELARAQRIRANRLAGNHREALLLATSWVHNQANCTGNTRFGKNVLAEYVWLTIEQKNSPEHLTAALRDVDGWLFSSGGAIRLENKRSARELLIERARLLIALNRRDEAEQNLERYLTDSDKRSPNETYPRYVSYAEACLLLGYLKEQSGRAEEAQTIWKKAIWRESSREFFGVNGFPLNGRPHVYHMILSSLTGDSGDLDPHKMLLSLLSGTAATGDAAGGNAILRQTLQLVDFDARFVQRAFATPQAREWCRRIAFQDLSFEEFVRVPLKLCALEYIRGQAFAGKLDGDQEMAVWEILHSIIEQYHAERLNETQLILCASVWKGTNIPGIFGWAQAESALAVQLRSQFAYLFGHRYQKLKRTAEAKTFFEYTVKHAPPDSDLQKQAQAALEEISAAGR